MRFCSLGSGSSGNAALIDSGDTLIMLDCGFPCKETTRRLQQINIDPEKISAILVTHEHNDHLSGVGVFSRKYNTPVWMNYGTYRQKNIGKLHSLTIFNSFQPFTIGSITIEPIIVPHDSREAVQFIFHYRDKRLGVLTDLGHISSHIVSKIKNLQAMIIEANHCPQMLQNGSYAPSLKKRVAGDYGHLNNYQAAELIKLIDTKQCQHIIAAHLSQENNHPQQARQTFAAVLKNLPDNFHIAAQQDGFDWKVIN